MTRLESILRQRAGSLLLWFGGVLVFLFWRIAGMPLPGTLGRLIPLAWIIAALTYGPGKAPRGSIVLLAMFPALSLLWAAGGPMFLLASSCGLLGVFPALMKIARRRWGILMALLPLVPMVLVTVPFTGDEPHYAKMTEVLYPADGSLFQEYSQQAGDPSSTVRHHQSLFPLLMLPGYPLGIMGLRTVNVLFAITAAMLMAALFGRSGMDNGRRMALLGLLMLPGSSILGLVYPGWLALALMLSAVYLWFRGHESRRLLSIFLVVILAGLLVLVKFRFAGISLGILAALTMEFKGGKRILVPAGLVLLAVLALLADLTLFGGRAFWIRYGNVEFLKTLFVQPVYRLGDLAGALSSTFLDIESGLLWKAPWILAGIAGLPLLRRERPELYRWLGYPALFYLLLLVYWMGPSWNGAPTPSGRMLLPVMPVLVASLGSMMKRRGTDLLVWLSLALSALYMCHPILRFNYADGSDALVSLLAGPVSGLHALLPSELRFNLIVYLCWGFAALALIRLLYRNSRASVYLILSAFGFMCVAGGAAVSKWQAEDLPVSMSTFCRSYPGTLEPDSRKFWLFSRERMLHLYSNRSSVRIPLESVDGDSVQATIVYRNAERDGPNALILRCGQWSDTCHAVSSAEEPPRWSTMIREVHLEERPENLVPIEFVATFPRESDTLNIEPLLTVDTYDETSGIFLDRISIRQH